MIKALDVLNYRLLIGCVPFLLFNAHKRSKINLVDVGCVLA